MSIWAPCVWDKRYFGSVTPGLSGRQRKLGDACVPFFQKENKNTPFRPSILYQHLKVNLWLYCQFASIEPKLDQVKSLEKDGVTRKKG